MTTNPKRATLNTYINHVPKQTNHSDYQLILVEHKLNAQTHPKHKKTLAHRHEKTPNVKHKRYAPNSSSTHKTQTKQLQTTNNNI